MKRFLTPRLAKIALSAVLLVILGLVIDWDAVARALLQARPGWLLAAMALLWLARVVITWRWWTILRTAGHGMRFGALLRVVSAGIGLGSLLPSSVGPDIVRGVLLRTEARPEEQRIGTGAVVSSLVLDRYCATLGTILVAIAGAAAMRQAWLAAALVLLTAAIAAATWALVRWSARLIRPLTPGPLARLRPKLAALTDYLRAPGIVRRALIPATLISALLTLVRTGVFVTLYLAFGHAVPLGLALVAIPVMLTALMVPVTVGGFGVREWLLVVSFSDLGIPPEISVSVGVLAFVLQMTVSLPAIVRTISIARPRLAAAQAGDPPA